MMSSVFCEMSPSASGGISSGLIGCPTTCMSASRAGENRSVSARHLTIWRIKVLGSEALGAYMLIWSPPKVHQPSASSDISPGPTISPPVILQISMSTCVRSRAWAFSYAIS